MLLFLCMVVVWCEMVLFVNFKNAPKISMKKGSCKKTRAVFVTEKECRAIL